MSINLDSTDWLVVPTFFGKGNFSAVPVIGSDAAGPIPRAVTPDDPSFYLLEEAVEYAESRPDVRMAFFHPMVLSVPYSRWGARWYRLKRRWKQRGSV